MFACPKVISEDTFNEISKDLVTRAISHFCLLCRNAFYCPTCSDFYLYFGFRTGDLFTLPLFSIVTLLNNVSLSCSDFQCELSKT